MSLNENFIQITNSIFLKNRKKNFPYKLDTQIDSQAKQVVLLQKGDKCHFYGRYECWRLISLLHNTGNLTVKFKGNFNCQIAHVNDWISFSSRRILSSDIPIYLFTTLLKIWKLLSFWKIALPLVPWSFNNHIRMPKNFALLKRPCKRDVVGGCKGEII